MADAALMAPARPVRREIAETLKLAGPLILTNLTQTLIGVTDVVLMGWLSADALASGALGFNLYFGLLIFGIGLITASSPMIAAEKGRNRHSVRDVRRTVRQAFWAATTLCVPAWLILWQAEAILLAFGQEPHLAAGAASYVHTLMWAFMPTLFYLVLRSYVAALERPAMALLVGALAVVVNAIAVWALMFGRLGLPALGLPGAGIGSFIAALFMFVAMAVVVSVDRQFRRYHLFGRFWRPDWRRYRELMRLGLPIGVVSALEVTIFNAAVFLMGLIGTSSLAAHAIVIQIASLTFMVPLGFSQAVTVRVGRAYGANDPDGIRRAGWTAYGLGIGCMVATALLIYAIPERLVGFFLDVHAPENAEVVGLALAFLAIVAPFQLVDGAQILAAGMLRGLHDTRIPMIYAATGFWGVGFGLGVVLAFWAGLGGVGIWLGLTAGLTAVSAMMLQRWIRRRQLGLERLRHA